MNESSPRSLKQALFELGIWPLILVMLTAVLLRLWLQPGNAFAAPRVAEQRTEHLG